MSDPRRTVVVAAGAAGAPALLAGILRPGDRLVAADGGADAIFAAGLCPEVVVGDMDSIGPRARARVEDDPAIEIRRHPVRKDATDSQLALEYVLADGDRPREILMFGVFGDRLDHALGLVQFVAGLEEAERRRIAMTDGTQWVRVLGAGEECPVAGDPGDTVSLLPLTPRVTGVSLEGFSFPLEDGALSWGSTLGISNELEDARGRVRIRGQGILLLIHTRG